MTVIASVRTTNPLRPGRVNDVRLARPAARRASAPEPAVPVAQGPHRDATAALMQSARARQKFQNAEWISADQVVRLLDTMAADLHEALNNQELDQRMAAIRDLAKVGERASRAHGVGHLSLECSASLRYELLHVCRLVGVLPTPPGTGMARLDFIRHNLVALERTCFFSWARIARSELVQMFNHYLATEMVTNPAMNDSAGGSVSVELSAPVPIASVGVEVGAQRQRRIDDEGNLVLTSSASVTLGAAISLPFLGVKLGQTGSYGSFGYCRTAKDHALLHFAQMAAEYSQVPALARYMSCAGAAGLAITDPAEIAQFDTMQAAFILKQDRYAQHLSLLLGSAAPGRAAAQPLRDRHCQVNLRERRDPYIRTMQGTIRSESTKLAGALRTVVAQADGQFEALNRTNRLYRTRTLCEFLKDPYVSDPAKQALAEKIARACAPVKRGVAAFWDLPAQPDPTALRIAEFERLKLDWKHYTQFHAQSAQGPLCTSRALALFHEKYGARSRQVFLRNVAMLTIDLYARMRAGGGPVAEVLEFEQALHQTCIPGAREYLERYAQTTQEVIYRTKESTVLLMATSGGQQSGIRINTAKSSHYTPWRNGESVRVEFIVGSDMTMNQQIMHTIANYFKVAAPSAVGHFGATSFTRQGSYVVRLYRSYLIPGQPFRKSYVRRVEQITQQTGGSMAIPLPAPVLLKGSLNQTATRIRMIDERLESDSVQYFAMHYTHARWTNKIDASGKLLHRCYWDQIEKLHSGALEQLFGRYGGTPAEASELLDELRAIERAFMLDESRMVRVDSIKRDFLACARQLHLARNLDNYRATLAAFKNLLNDYFEGWKDTREASPNWQDWTTDLV